MMSWSEIVGFAHFADGAIAVAGGLLLPEAISVCCQIDEVTRLVIIYSPSSGC